MDLGLQLLLNGIVLGARYSFVAVGFALILKTTGLFHFSHGVVFVAALYGLVVGVDTLGLPLLLAAVFAAVVVACLGFAIERVVYSPLRSRGASPMTLVVASLGVLILIENLIVLRWGPNAKSVSGLTFDPFLRLGDVTLTVIDLVTVAISGAVCSLALVFLRRSQFGLEILAVSSNKERAEILGISPRKVYGRVFIVASALVAIPATLVAVEEGVNPHRATDAVLIAAIATIIGGVGSVGGAIVGAFIVGIAQSVGVWQFSSAWQQAIAFIVLVAFILVRPTGLAGRVSWQSHV